LHLFSHYAAFALVASYPVNRARLPRVAHHRYKSPMASSK
jgi:hypothetical protein